MSNHLVEVQAASRVYRAGVGLVAALSSATCTVAPGDRIALVGPSGGGKSTLLHLMAGLETPSSGTVVWPTLGRRETLRPKQIACVFQSANLLAPLTVIENVEVPLVLGRVGAAKARQAALAALGRLGLAGLADRLPEELSGGQAQRVAAARALAGEPRLILADEPTSQLDHGTAAQVLDLLLDSLEGTETALVVATHDPEIAGRLRVLWRLEHGRLEVAA